MTHEFLKETLSFIIIVAFFIYQKKLIDKENSKIEQLKNELNGDLKWIY